ncbi:MAG: hypothetical protein JWN80_2985 [Microbacteriaceae bacterium]|nr:hypothetical protein [Microbacteriaceae bacterium]
MTGQPRFALSRVRSRAVESLALFYREAFDFRPVMTDHDAVEYLTMTRARGLLRIPYLPHEFVVMRLDDQFIEIERHDDGPDMSGEPLEVVVSDLAATARRLALASGIVQEEAGRLGIRDPEGGRITVSSTSRTSLGLSEPPAEIRGHADSTIDVDGCAIAVRHWPGLLRDAESLFLIHGSRAHRTWWNRTMNFLDPTIPATAIDQSGHGDSGHRERYTPQLWAEEVRAAILAKSTIPVTLVGHSIGGRLALIVASLFPELVRQVVIVDSPVHPVEIDPSRVASPPREFADEASAISRFKLLPAQPWPVGSPLTAIARAGLRKTGDAWRWKFDPACLGVLSDDSLIAALPGITRPVHVVRAELSRLATPSDARFLRNSTGQPTTDFMIEGAFHHVPLDSAPQLAEVLAGLVDQRQN